MGSAKLVYNAELEYDATHEASVAHPLFFLPLLPPRVGTLSRLRPLLALDCILY